MLQQVSQRIHICIYVYIYTQKGAGAHAATGEPANTCMYICIYIYTHKELVHMLQQGSQPEETDSRGRTVAED